MQVRVSEGAAAAARAATAAALRRGAAPLVAGLGLALAARWYSPPGPGGDLAGALALAAWATLALALRRRDAALSLGVYVAHVALEAAATTLPLAFAWRLRLDATSAVLLPLAFALLVRAARRGGVEAPARPLATLGVALALVGTALRLGATSVLLGRDGDAATVAYVLRYDGAYALWGFAATAFAFAFGSALLSRGAPRPRRRRLVLAAASVAFLLVALDMGAVVASVAAPRPALEVGYHADRVSQVPAGASLVHLEAAWPLMEPAEGEFRWERLAHELDEAALRGLGVYLLVNTYPPEWLVRKYPDAAMVDAAGERFTWLDEAPGTPRERVWDMSFADERVVAAKRGFLAAALDRFGDHPAVRYVAVQNEPAYPFDWNLLRWASFDPHTVARFRGVVAAENDFDLDALNEAYGTRFESWDEVRPPTLPFGRLGERWVTFREDLLISFVQDLVATARERTDRPVTVKIMAHALTRFAEPQAGLGDRVYRAFADASDVVSVDLYPMTRADLVRSLRYFRELAGEKPLVVAEFHLALGSGLPGASARLLEALRTMEGQADAVILFTASHHYLYSAGPGTAAQAGVAMFGARPGDPGFDDALRQAVAAEWATAVALPRAAWAAAHAMTQLPR